MACAIGLPAGHRPGTGLAQSRWRVLDTDFGDRRTVAAARGRPGRRTRTPADAASGGICRTTPRTRTGANAIGGVPGAERSRANSSNNGSVCCRASTGWYLQGGRLQLTLCIGADAGPCCAHSSSSPTASSSARASRHPASESSPRPALGRLGAQGAGAAVPARQHAGSVARLRHRHRPAVGGRMATQRTATDPPARAAWNRWGGVYQPALADQDHAQELDAAFRRRPRPASSSAPVWPARPWPVRWRCAAGRSRCWIRRATAAGASGLPVGLFTPQVTRDDGPRQVVARRHTDDVAGGAAPAAPGEDWALSASPHVRAPRRRSLADRLAGCQRQAWAAQQASQKPPGTAASAQLADGLRTRPCGMPPPAGSNPHSWCAPGWRIRRCSSRRSSPVQITR